MRSYTFHSLFHVFLVGTDINGGVLRGVNMLVNDRKQGRLSDRSIDMIILLTDGMPNYGKHLERAWAVGRSVFFVQVHVSAAYFTFSITFVLVVCVGLKERVTLGGSRRIYFLLLKEKCLYSVLDLEMMWITHSWM